MPVSSIYFYFGGYHDGHYTLLYLDKKYPDYKTIEEIIQGPDTYIIHPCRALPKDILDMVN